MALNGEWKKRIEVWIDALTEHMYTPLGEITFNGFFTYDRLTLEQAQQQKTSYMPEGTRWGSKWQYGWFFSHIKLPSQASGKKMIAKINVGGESLVFVNQSEFGSIDRMHFDVTLSPAARAGDRYAIAVESYAGHGLRKGSVGPVKHGTDAIPEPEKQQVCVGNSTYGIFEEEVFSLWVDATTLYQLLKNIDPDSLQAARIEEALQEFTLTADLELPYDEKITSFQEARKVLLPMLSCKNASNAPTFYAFGHSHIDVAWLWTLSETDRKCARTFSNQLQLMEHDKDYRFFQSQAYLYDRAKKLYPDLYAKIKERVKQGRFIPEGGMWVEADTNISGGESLIRQFLYGKSFYQEEFGIDSKMLWLPDVFGYSGALPQILKGCEIEYFSTHKIFWNYKSENLFPYNNFYWEGIDGTQILSHLYLDYNAKTDPDHLIRYWKERPQKNHISTRVLPFGDGDGGGGATREHLAFLKRAKDLEGVPKCIYAGPLEFFDELSKQKTDNHYVGELYYACHRGTYTTQAKTKKGNRKAEFALREAEFLASAAQFVSGYQTPMDLMHETWKKLLVNQFHDILPGSSIKKVHDEAERDFAEVIKTAEDIGDAAARSIINKESSNTQTVFNSYGQSREMIVTLPEGAKSAVDDTGQALVCQSCEDTVYARIDVPAFGHASFEWSQKPSDETPCFGTRIIDGRIIENEFMHVTIDEYGRIESILDKKSGRLINDGACNDLRMYKDCSVGHDAWDIDSMYEQLPIKLGKATIKPVCEGPLFAKMRITRHIHHSVFTQIITVYAHHRRIDFHTTVDWKEDHKLLKVNFPCHVITDEVLSDIQFGAIKRPTHRSKPSDREKYEICNHKWSALMEENCGAALINDCKYGLSAERNSLNLTLLKSSLAPDMYADKGIHTFTYAFYYWDEPFVTCDLIKHAYDVNLPVTMIQGGAPRFSMLHVDAPNIVIESIKPSHDGSGDTIVRLYESKRTRTKTRLFVNANVERACLATMLENKREPLSVEDGYMTLSFTPYEIKTVRMRLST